jgi:hypothetical protein
VLPKVLGCRLYVGWCCGELAFTKVDLRQAK